MNARCERFNRTLQEEFLDYHEELLCTDLKAFNDKLFDWLLWYNTERPHHALGLNTPASVVASCLPPTQCRMYWPNTLACHGRVIGSTYVGEPRHTSFHQPSGTRSNVEEVGN